MESFNKEQRLFFALIKAGLWESSFKSEKTNEIDFLKTYKLAEEQAVVGLLVAGLEQAVDLNVPRDITLMYASCIVQIEQRNKAMNVFIAEIYGQLRKKDIKALLVKGQGIAQCYERPLWRASGDVDIFLDQDYTKAVAFLSALATEVDKEIKEKLHQAMTIQSWNIDVHGTLRSGLWKQVDVVLDEVQKATFNGEVRTWHNGSIDILLPAPNNDVIFVFCHIIQHFFRGGIGLRQVCDWCRLLWTYKETIDTSLLKTRLIKAGLMSEWQAFASLAVNYLGASIGAMPFYTASKKWTNKATLILSLIMETGNFGYNRDYSYYTKYPVLIQKSISFWRYTKDSLRCIFIFPKDSLKMWCRIVKDGLLACFRKE